jgi:hypothetical protein
METKDNKVESITKKEIKKLENVITRQNYDDAKEMLKKAQKTISEFQKQKENEEISELLSKQYYIQRDFDIYDVGRFYGFSDEVFSDDDSRGLIFELHGGSKLHTDRHQVYDKLKKSTMKVLNNC